MTQKENLDNCLTNWYDLLPVNSKKVKDKKTVDNISDLPLRPARFVEHRLITSILDGTYPPGSVLPAERTLAGLIGVTRPTLRESLHRLAGQGWFTICQGKPTKVNSFWENGGMGLLSILSKYSDFLPDGFVIHLLEVRSTLLPPIARLAAANEPQALLGILEQAKTIEDDAMIFTRFDWNLQISMARYSHNPVYTLILNDFSSMYEMLGSLYFQMEEARRSSRSFYLEMYKNIRSGGKGIERIVYATMEKSIDLWKNLKGNNL